MFTTSLIGDDMRAQTSMILIVIMIIIFGGIALFLFSFAKTISSTEYTNLYAHNLLLAIMRTDTGHSDTNCRLMSDTIASAFLTPTWTCGNSGRNYLSIANDTISEYMDPEFGLIREGFRYLFIAEPESFRSISPETGEPFKIKIGDLSLEEARVEKLVANERIQKVTETGQYVIKVQLIIARK